MESLISGTGDSLLRRYDAEICEVFWLRRRWIIRVPVLTPKLSSLWIGFVTPVPTD